MAKKKSQMPNSKAGLVRYFDDYQESIQLDPRWIVGGVVGLIAIELLLHWYGPGMFL